MNSSTARFVAYSDGSSIANPGGPGGTGFVVFDRSERNVAFGAKRYERDGEYAVTNNRMELRAVLEALETIPAGESVLLVSDSRYTLDAISKWIHGWRKKGWKTSQGTPVLNRDLIEAIDARTRSLKMTFEWCRGHHGHPVNELVDALAQNAARAKPLPGRTEVIAGLSRAGLIVAS